MSSDADGRPVSRRGNGSRNASSNVEVSRPVTASRPTTAGRPTTAMRPPSMMRAPPSTANRLQTGIAPPKTGLIINLERPITQQGLSGLRTGTANGPRRQVLDKRYFESLIRQKMKIIDTEVQRLSGEIETQRQHEATAEVYEARVKEVAQELTSLQAELMDYNLVVDRMHTGTDVADIRAEIEQVAADNARDSAQLEQLHQQNRELEIQIQHIDNQIQNEKNVAHRLLEEMEPEARDYYEQLKNNKEQLLAQITDQQQQIEYLKSKAAGLHEKISSSQIKQEAVLLYQKLKERQDRKAQLEAELKSKETPAQEREQLLQRVREDNAEMAAIERQIVQLTDQIKAHKQEIETIEQDLEEGQGDRHQKLKELRQREETMENFLQSFENARDTELERIKGLEEKVEIALQQMTLNLITPSIFPSKNDFAEMKETLNMKQDELEKSKMTAEELLKEEAKLRENVHKVEDLEEKIIKETASLKDQLRQMKQDMNILSDLDALRDNAKSKRDDLINQRDAFLKKKLEFPEEKLGKLKTQNNQLKKQLNENDTYVQLHTLEKKLQLLEDTNKTLKEQMNTKKTELDFQESKTAALTLLTNFNIQLQKKLKN